MKTKKGQHEILGFVIIVLIVCIIGVIFLSLSLGRGKPEKQTTVQISHFLESSMYYTTDCATNNIPNYENLRDLIKLCYGPNGDLVNCYEDNRTYCQALDSSLNKVLNLLDVGSDRPNKAYNLSLYYEDNKTTDQFLNMQKGNFKNCTSIKGASTKVYVSPGGIWVDLDLCS